MPQGSSGTIGLLPAGALGVALFHHLTAASTRCDGEVHFLARAGSSAPRRVAAGGGLHVEIGGVVRTLPAALQHGTLVAAAQNDALPEIVIACTNPDQLFDVLGDYVRVIQWEHEQGRALAAGSRLPALVLSANGIYHQRVRQTFIELIEEATLFGRLPDLWPEVMPVIVGRLLRGVTNQTGLRRGGGAEAVYRPGPPGRTVIAGGSAEVRSRVVHVLAARGGWYEDAGSVTATRAEFDKAVLNLASNLLGMRVAVDASGAFRPLTVAEVTAPPHHARIRELVEAVVHVGKALRVYPIDHDANTLFEQILTTSRAVGSHVPSSLQWVEAQLANGRLQPALTPTESWLLRPLQQYARSLGDHSLIHYFEKLETELVAVLARAAAFGKLRPGR